MIYRKYQQEYIDNLQINKSNLVISPMRSGKSVIIKGMVDKYFNNKKVLIITGIRHVITQLANYYEDYSFILSGHEYDSTKLINLASFQTFTRRNIDLSIYDAVFVDEVHMRFNTSIMKQIRRLNCTRVYFTGTPLTNRNRFISDEFDNIMEFITVPEMIEKGYLAKTRFMSIGNMLKDESELTVQNGDYLNEDIDRIIDKSALIQWLLQHDLEYNWSTEHKTIMYTNSIATTNKIVSQFNSPNVRSIHSKLTSKQIKETMDWFESTPNGIIINCRMLTVGVDIPSADTVVYLLPTKIHSLFLQSIFRASTKHGDKVATVYDYSGMLNKINPYSNEWRKHKLSCKDQCIKQYPNDKLAQYFCMEACKSEPILVPCNGELPYSLTDNPFITNFQVHEGTPCKESRPMWDYQFKQTEPGPGLLRKWTKCQCGLITSYDVKTLTEPSEMVLVYDDSAPVNTVTIIYSAEHHKALALFDDPKQTKYKILMFNSSTELYEHALKFFKNKPFQVLSNATMSKLPNVTVNTSLNEVMPLISWHSDNQGFIRKLIKAKMRDVITYLDIRPGYVYWTMKNINKDNEKQVLEFLNLKHIDRNQFLRFFKKFQPKEN